MLTFGLIIILLLLLIGGTIALAGDFIGTIIGRRRLTLFNLRPRYTAYTITILSGTLIAFTTMGILLAISQDARTALFGLEKLKLDLAEKSSLLEKTKSEFSLITAEADKINQELSDAKDKLRRSRLEIAALEKTREKLGREVEVSRKGKVLFQVGEVLLTSIIQAGPEREKLEAGLKQILSAADAYVRSFGVEQGKHLIFMSPEDFDLAVATLSGRSGENIVKVVANKNTVFGEEVSVHFAIQENRVIYRAGEMIAEAIIQPSLSIPEIEQEIKKLLYETNLSAKKAGIMPDASGSIGSVPYSQILSLAKKIKTYFKSVRVRALAKANTYAVGPLEIDFKILYQ
ncbi:MAG: DUF3084 domain-containing protein [Candidatus Margulisbacteria bacterium]|nr:DUF3084 domain-containing protein [Candidatus Margulisiibacteriota bacterium]